MLNFECTQSFISQHLSTQSYDMLGIMKAWSLNNRKENKNTARHLKEILDRYTEDYPSVEDSFHDIFEGITGISI